MTRLSIVIPALGNLDQLELGLVSVLQNRPKHCEVLVVLNTEYGDPYDLEGEVRFVAAPRGASLADSINAGIRASRSHIVHLLHCGAEVQEGWVEPALAHFTNHRLASVAPLVVDARDPARVVAAGLGYSLGGSRRLLGYGESVASAQAARAESLGPTHLAAFFRRDVALQFEKPFDPAVGDACADIDFALRLKRAGYLTRVETASVVACPPLDAPRQGFRRARGAERLFWRNVPETGKWAAVLAHGWLATLETLKVLPTRAIMGELTGRLLANLEWGSHARHRRLLAAHAEQLQALSAAENEQHSGGLLKSSHVRWDTAHETHEQRTAASRGTTERGPRSNQSQEW